MSKWRLMAAAGLLFGALAACADASSTADTVAVGGAPAVPSGSPSGTDSAVVDSALDASPDSSADGIGPAATLAPTTTGVRERWSAITAPADCMCSDGSGYRFFVHRASPTNVMFFLQGGGACFDAATCGPGTTSFTRTVGDTLDASSGIFDFENPANPFRDWSVVYVPYCTGDVHLGNATHDYGGGVVVQHKGFVNASAALTAMRDLFPSLQRLMVAGESAGSIPSPLFAGLAHDYFGNADITVLADGSGGYPDLPAVNATIGANWGTMNAVPPWPENDGMTVERWSIPGLFVQAHAHAPDIVLARHDFAFDRTQVFFSALAGIPADRLVELIDRNEAQIEATGADLLSYISPGDEHTILGRDEFYTHEVNGVSLLEWVTDLANGTPVTDNHCTECTAS